MKKLLKNKKASAIIESVMLAPIIIYVVMFSAFKLLSWYNYSTVYKASSVIVRRMSVAKTFEESLDILAYNLPENLTVTEIKIYNLIDDVDSSPQVLFPISEESGFSKYIKEDKTFDYDNWNSSKKQLLENSWISNSIIKIKISKNMSYEVTKLFNYKIYDPTTKETIDLSIGFETSTDAYGEYVIYN